MTGVRIALVGHERHTWKLRPLSAELGPVATVVSIEALARGAELPTGVSSVFHKVRRDPGLRVLEGIAARGIRVVNPPAGVRRAADRYLALAAAGAVGVETAEQYRGALADVPFEEYVLKDPIDDHKTRITVVRTAAEHARLLAQKGPEARIYAQRRLEAAVELKLYVIGGRVHAFAQAPREVCPDKLATRRETEVPAWVADAARRAVAAAGLVVGGADFLVHHGAPRLTDINSSQSLHHYPGCVRDVAGVLRLSDKLLAPAA